jgi:ketosteroid isomerase-like protein
MQYYHVASRIVWGVIMCGLLAACATVPTDDERQTPDERTIVQLLKDHVSAYNARDTEALLAAYAPDAKIETLLAYGAVASREQFAVLLRELSVQHTAFLRSLTVNVLSDNRAEATALIRLVDKDDNIIFRRGYQLERHAGQWRIVAEHFVGSIPQLLQRSK